MKFLRFIIMGLAMAGLCITIIGIFFAFSMGKTWHIVFMAFYSIFMILVIWIMGKGVTRRYGNE